MITTLLAAALLFADPPSKPETIKVATDKLAAFQIAVKDAQIARKDQQIIQLQFDAAKRAEAEANMAAKAAIDAIFAEAKVSRADYDLNPQTGELVHKPKK